MKKITLIRDSISTRDDCVDHTLVIEVEIDWKIDQILKKVIDLNYLPKIYGGKATWSVAFDKPIAIIAEQWWAPFLICEKDYPYQGTDKFKNIDKLRFNYHAQDDPELVLAVLSTFKTV